MPHPEQTYRWTWELKATPAALWPLVSNTDRFNRDCGYPAVTKVAPGTGRGSRPPLKALTNGRRLRARKLGLTAEWDEQPFDWVEPSRFSVDRHFLNGPIARLLTTCELAANAAGGTSLAYELRVTPADWIGRLLSPLVFGRQSRAATDRVFRRYDELALRGQRVSRPRIPVQLAAGGAPRLEAIRAALTSRHGQPAALAGRLTGFVMTADDLSAARMRPYALADEWGEDRRDTLHLFLHSTRAGLLDFSWDLVCPHCRGASPGPASLAGISGEAHCPSCDIDFTVNFDQSVELTFVPNAAVRPVTRTDYCIGGPQVTPHIVAQQLLPGGGHRTLPLALAPGRYRIRSPRLPGQPAFRVAPRAASEVRIELGTTGGAEPAVAPSGALTLVNAGSEEHLAIVEHVAWSDQAATAAEVTSLQLFRDLFSSEVIRPGEQISVGALTVVFTDLKNSTQLYREIGDAPAFGRVLTHFEILKAAVAAERGAVVKTMGDAIMAVFPRPLAAVRAVVHAQHWLARPTGFPLPPGVNVPRSSLQPLALKAGINTGPCLAINQNDRLDYFGSTVNVAARLCALCSGSDIVLSQAVHADAEVQEWLAGPDQVTAEQEMKTLKGFGDEAFTLWRMRLHLGFSRPPFQIGVPKS